MGDDDRYRRQRILPIDPHPIDQLQPRHLHVRLLRTLNNEHRAILDAAERYDRFLKRHSQLCFAQSP
jgi:hypothetical protein